MKTPPAKWVNKTSKSIGKNYMVGRVIVGHYFYSNESGLWTAQLLLPGVKTPRPDAVNFTSYKEAMRQIESAVDIWFHYLSPEEGVQ